MNVMWRHENVLSLPATLNCHKSAHFERNGIGLFGQPRWYKHCPNAPHCSVIVTLPILSLMFCDDSE